jgi:hypothetical protein
MLSIIIASPIITLSTNSLINMPLQYWFLQLKLRLNNVKEAVPIGRILRSAFYQAFHHWLVIVCGWGAVYVFLSTFWLIEVVRHQDHQTQLSTEAVASFFQVGSSMALVRLVQLNAVCNYGVGIATAAGFWISKLVAVFRHTII